MATETHERRSLPSETRYRVVGTGPRAEAQHGRYVRSVLRYLRANQPTQWLIATEAITKPSALAEGDEGARTPTGSDSDTSSTTNSSDSTGTSQPDPLRRQLFKNDESAPAQEGIPSTAASDGPGDGTQNDGSAVGVQAVLGTQPHREAAPTSTQPHSPAVLTRTQLAALRSSRRTQARDANGRFASVKEERPHEADTHGSAAATAVGEENKN